MKPGGDIARCVVPSCHGVVRCSRRASMCPGPAPAKREEAQAPRWHVAVQPGKRRQLDPARQWARLLEQAEQLKASIRAKVEHPFNFVKSLFRHEKAHYKGLAKNEAQLFCLFGLADLLVIAKRRLLALHARGAS